VIATRLIAASAHELSNHVQTFANTPRHESDASSSSIVRSPSGRMARGRDRCTPGERPRAPRSGSGQVRLFGTSAAARAPASGHGNAYRSVLA
jgi:hypothetical protein